MAQLGRLGDGPNKSSVHIYSDATAVIEITKSYANLPSCHPFILPLVVLLQLLSNHGWRLVGSIILCAILILEDPEARRFPANPLQSKAAPVYWSLGCLPG